MSQKHKINFKLCTYNTLTFKSIKRHSNLLLQTNHIQSHTLKLKPVVNSPNAQLWLVYLWDKKWACKFNPSANRLLLCTFSIYWPSFKLSRIELFACLFTWYFEYKSINKVVRMISHFSFSWTFVCDVGVVLFLTYGQNEINFVWFKVNEN